MTEFVFLGTIQITMKTPNIDIHSFIIQKVVIEDIYLFIYVPGTDLGAYETSENNVEKKPCSLSLTSC